MYKFVYKVPFFVLLIVDMIIAAYVWKGASGTASPLYAFTDYGWSNVLSNESLNNVRSMLRIDAFGALSAALMSFIALIAGARALADRESPITPRKVIFFLVTYAGFQGIFYMNDLKAIFVFLLLIQFGVSGLYGVHVRKVQSRIQSRCYYASRIVLLLMFLSGVMILKSEYGTYNIGILASQISPTSAVLLSYILLVTPLLYIFIKPSPYLNDAASDCFFGMRVQASLFVVFRIIFSLYGPMSGLQKVPALFIILGFAVTSYALLLSFGARDPERFMRSVLFYMKGMILVSIGISMNGLFSAEKAVLFGVSAIEATISLWLLFLPVSAALAIITVFLKQKYEERELWEEGALSRRVPLTSFSLFIVVCVLAGLPPFIGYSGKQLLFRSSNFISPFILTALFAFTVSMLITGLRFLVTLMLGKVSRKREDYFYGESAIALPLILLLLLFSGTTLLPGKLFDESVAPSVESLINRTMPSDSDIPVDDEPDGGENAEESGDDSADENGGSAEEEK